MKLLLLLLSLIISLFKATNGLRCYMQREDMPTQVQDCIEYYHNTCIVTKTIVARENLPDAELVSRRCDRIGPKDTCDSVCVGEVKTIKLMDKDAGIRSCQAVCTEESLSNHGQLLYAGWKIIGFLLVYRLSL